MRHYVVIYDRAQQCLVRLSEHGDRQNALNDRWSAEAQHRDDANIEIVVLSAESRDALERTHSRYFKSLRDLLAQ